MKPLVWNEEKNNILKNTRGISFDEVSAYLETNDPIAKIAHPNKKTYPNQYLMIIEYNKDVYVIPFIEETSYIFLKTVYRSTKYKKQFLKKGKIV